MSKVTEAAKKLPSRKRRPGVQSGLNPRKPKPGIFYGIPFEIYCDIPAINNSSLSAVLRSPLHYRKATPQEPGPAYRLGSYVHECKLEPELIAKKYIVLPEDEWIKKTQAWAKVPGNRRGKDDGQEYSNPKAAGYYKNLRDEFLQRHPGKQEVSLTWYNNTKALLKSLVEHELAGPIFKHGQPEATIIWVDETTRLLCKGRLDWLNIPDDSDDWYINDLKTTDDVLRWDIDKFDYHRQAAFYIDGIATLTGFSIPFWFTVAEKTPPFCVACAPAHDRAIHEGRREYQHALKTIKECKAKRRWPGPKSPASWSLSQYFKSKVPR